tara:strand:- start:684 stop:3623 length:2940 start_codon:yes stop_codon:yes gene_type:complete
MAATNDPNVTAEILSRVNSDLEKFGYITEDTAQAMKDAETGVKNFAKKADQAADLTLKAFTAVASTGIEAAMAMHEGAKGNQAFNSSLDKMKEGVEATGALLTALIPGGPLVKAFVAALTMAAGKAVDMQKVYGKMSDDLFKGFQDISKSGAAASDGMDGLQAGMRKLGLGVQDMDSYVKVISASSKDLALFKGSVFEGRKAFENIGQGMLQYNYQLRAAGLNQEEINAGTMSYLKLQTQVGMAQTMTTRQLAEGAKKYLIEQDALTKLTGASRQEMEAAQEAARSEQRFRAKLESMRASGDAKQIAAADELEKANKILSSQSKEAGQGFRDLSTGMVTSEAAQKALTGTNGVALEQATKIAAGQANAIDGVQQVARAFGQNAKDLNMLGQTGTYEDISIKFADAVTLGIFANKNLAVEYEKIQEELKKQGVEGGKANNALTDANIRLAKVQQEEMLKLQAITAQGMQGAVDNNIKLATESGKLSEVYDRLTIIMIKFQAMMGRVIEWALPGLINGLETLLDLIETIPGMGPDKRSDRMKKADAGYDKAFENASFSQKYLGIDRTEEQTKTEAELSNTWKEEDTKRRQQAKAERDASRGDTAKAAASFSDKLDAFFGFRAAGGPVKANAPYIVGEKGPELFVPNGAGNIVANNDLQQNVSMPNMPDMSNEYKKIESGILSASKNSQMLADLTPEYKKIDLATKDIVADIQKMAKYDDLRATNTKTFTEKYTDYTKSMSDLLDQDLVNTTRFMEAGGTVSVSGAMSSGGGYGGGQGIKPTGSGAPGMTGADSLQGLKMKKGDVHAEGAGVHPKLVEMAKQVQANMPNFAYFSAFNDQYHQENAPSSFHTKGLAMDFALSKAPTKEEGQAIVKYLQSIGASTAIDEYNNPSSKSTAGHIHAQIPGFADGGIAMEPTIAMVAEKAPEVMMPLTNDGFLGQLNTSINSLLPQQQRMVSLLEDMGRSMQATATASERMAAVASN